MHDGASVLKRLWRNGSFLAVRKASRMKEGLRPNFEGWQVYVLRAQNPAGRSAQRRRSLNEGLRPLAHTLKILFPEVEGNASAYTHRNASPFACSIKVALLLFHSFQSQS